MMVCNQCKEYERRIEIMERMIKALQHQIVCYRLGKKSVPEWVFTDISRYRAMMEDWTNDSANR